MLLGIGLFSAITATVTSFMLEGRHAVGAADRLRDLVRLRDDGLLTTEEYAAKREEVIRAL
jgi:hypothetical protein